MPTLSVCGNDLYYERRGGSSGGDPLVLIQGMSGNSVHWGERFLSELEQDLDLILYDHRGIGRSGRVTDPFTTADLAGDAGALLDALEVERAHVFGISMGGMVAQHLVLDDPDRFTTLTLGATYCGGPESHVTDEGVIQMLREAMLSGDKHQAIRAGWQVNVSAGYAADQDNYATWVEVAEAYPAPIPVIVAQLQAVQGHDTSARMHEIDTPTLVVHGTADQMLSVRNADLIARLVPGARLELLEDVGHLFFWERPEESARLVRDHVLSVR